jgi:hypothetical protein
MREKAKIKSNGEIVEILGITQRICSKHGCGPLYFVRFANGTKGRIAFFNLEIIQKTEETK